MRATNPKMIVFTFYSVEALNDANRAIKLQDNNATAYLRQGIAYFELEEFESAKESFEKCQKISDQLQVRRWLRKCAAEISAENEENESDNTNANVNEPAAPAKVEATERTPQPIPPLAAASAAHDAVIPPRQSVRHEWYQSPTTVVISIFAKGITKEQCEIESGKDTLGVTIKLNENSEYVLDLALCDTIIAEKTTTIFTPTKVEIKMIKDKQCKWLTLERTQDAIKTLEWDTSKTSKPEYPSSSRIKKDWNAIDKSVEEEKLQGEQALNKVFQDIFARGTDEQKKAMEKSFVESGGTVLSTNWDDIGSRKVEGAPPKGAELRHWSDINK